MKKERKSNKRELVRSSITINIIERVERVERLSYNEEVKVDIMIIEMRYCMLL